MLAHNFLSPTGSDGSFTRLPAAAGYDGNAVSEVIAQGAFASLDAVLLAWLDEPDPRCRAVERARQRIWPWPGRQRSQLRWTLTPAGDTSAAAIPEPGALWLVLLGLAASPVAPPACGGYAS